MIVCICKGMSAAALRERIASGERTLAALARTTGVTTDCGTCAPAIRELLAEATGASAPTEPGGKP